METNNPMDRGLHPQRMPLYIMYTTVGRPCFLINYAPTPAPSSPFKTILELVLWNSLQNCRRITPDVISVIKMPSFQYFLYLREQNRERVPAQLLVD
jgi:hypothetical protein